jgi:hypothetical protein
MPHKRKQRLLVSLHRLLQLAIKQRLELQICNRPRSL